MVYHKKSDFLLHTDVKVMVFKYSVKQKKTFQDALTGLMELHLCSSYSLWKESLRIMYLLVLSATYPDVTHLSFFLQEEKVDSSLEFLILASDGLWDVVTNEVWF